MKKGLYTPRPGDLFNWHYDHDDSKCKDDDKVWSSSMKCWVLCNGINILISLTETDMWWINNQSFIHARVDKIPSAAWVGVPRRCFIHARVDKMFTPTSTHIAEPGERALSTHNEIT